MMQLPEVVDIWVDCLESLIHRYDKMGTGCDLSCKQESGSLLNETRGMGSE